MLLIKNGNLITMAGMYEQTGDILIDDGKIVKVGQVGEVPEDCQIIDAAGRTVTPGLVDPHCHAGLWGTACREEMDGNEYTEPVLPGLRGLDAINPEDATFDAALRQGITTVVTGPGSSNIVGGTFLAIKTAGEDMESRVICPELPFPIVFHEVTTPEEVIEMNGYKITAFRVQHNITCYGYSLEISRKGKFDVERAKAQEIPIKCWNPLQKGKTVTLDGKTYTPDMVLGPARKGLKVTYCTDTRPIPSISEHAKGSDLFICEGMYGEPEKQAKAKEFKHMTFYEAAKLAKDAEAAEMWLTHFSPSLVGPQRYMDEVQKIFPAAELGKDGRSVELLFEEETKNE